MKENVARPEAGPRVRFESQLPGPRGGEGIRWETVQKSPVCRGQTKV